MHALTRRRFLKISAATFGAGAAATQIQPLTRLAHAAAPPGEVKTIPTFCEMCFWRCGGIAHVRDGKLWKFEGNPRDPQSRGRLCPRGTGAVGSINRSGPAAHAADPHRRARQGSMEVGHVG
jgi:thiosulfate reductase / polysulfide reductase chain A